MGGLGKRGHPDATHNVLLEGAAWNFINIRRTVPAQRLHSEAAYRFARGVHPALAELGVRLCLKRMAAVERRADRPGLVDEYPLTVDRSRW